MPLDEIIISKAIIETFSRKLMDYLDMDVAIVGAGPAGLCCAYYLAKKNVKVAVFERKLSVGGGMWGGGMMFNEIVVQQAAKGLLDEFGIRSTLFQPGYYTADSVEAVAALCTKTVQSGAKIFNLISAEDIMIRKNRVAGLVLNWTAVEVSRLHVDPLAVKARYVVDATGHDAEVARIAERKSGLTLKTQTGKTMGEKSLWAEPGEQLTVKNSKEVCPGLYVIGMGANAVSGGPRMGPVFGGMLLSGQKVAGQLIKKLNAPAAPQKRTRR